VPGHKCGNPVGRHNPPDWVKEAMGEADAGIELRLVNRVPGKDFLPERPAMKSACQPSKSPSLQP